MKTLLLNADYKPLKVISWRKAFSLSCRNVVSNIDYYSRKVMDSAGRFYPIPAVVRLNKYVHKKTQLTKRNLFLRDRYLCQYCGIKLNDETATLDHIKPRSLGGTHCWENLVTSCGKCNRKKGDKYPYGNVKARRPGYINPIIDSYPPEWEPYAQT